jgi:hypothetical protein
MCWFLKLTVTKLTIWIPFSSVFRIGLQDTKELSGSKIDKKTLQKGFLLEFVKDSERSLLAVVERPDGKKNWVVTDQV